MVLNSLPLYWRLCLGNACFGPPSVTLELSLLNLFCWFYPNLPVCWTPFDSDRSIISQPEGQWSSLSLPISHSPSCKRERQELSPWSTSRDLSSPEHSQCEVSHFFFLITLCLLLSCSVVSNSLQPHGMWLSGFSAHGLFQARIL